MISPNLDEGIQFHSHDLDTPLLSMTLSRTDFYNKMINHLMKTTNSRVEMNTKIVDVEIKCDRAIFHTKNGKDYSCLVVVRADSTISTVSRSLSIGLFDKKLN